MTQPLKREQKVTVTLQRWQWQHVIKNLHMFIGCPECMKFEHQILQQLRRDK